MRQRKSLLFIIPLLIFLNGCVFYRSIHLAGAEPNIRKLKDRPYEVLGEVENTISNMFSPFILASKSSLYDVCNVQYLGTLGQMLQKLETT